MTTMPNTPFRNASFDVAKRDRFVESVMTSINGGLKAYTIYIGDRLGYYEALRDGQWSTAGALADGTGTQERYTREWLEQQTVNGILEVEDASAPPEKRRFRLPAEHAEALAEPDSLNFMAPLAQVFVGAASPIGAVLEAFRTGGGVHFDGYGRDMRQGQARINRPAFLSELGQQWIPAMPDVDQRLRDDPPARIADIGCGSGWSSIGMARCYPQACVDGFDLDAASVEDAQKHVAASGLSDRVEIRRHDCGDPELAGAYDLVTAFECVHDLSDPVAVLSAMGRLTAPGGAVLVADERVGERFTAESDDVERMMYGWSVLHCLPCGMADAPSQGTGTVMRPHTLSGYAHEAGFGRVEVLPIEHPFFRFYRLYP